MKKEKLLLSIALAMLYSLTCAETYRCNTKEKMVYLSNKDEIDSIIDFRATEELIKLNNYYYIPVESREHMEHVVRNREFRLICQEYLYRDSLRRRIQNKIEIEYAYQDSINAILIPAYENHISGENVSYVLHISKLLKLDTMQYSHIMNKALDMARRIRKDYRTNVWNEEMEILKTTLDKKQLHSFFVNKNATKVTDEFNKAWKKLEEAGLTEQLDSAKDANYAVNYMFNRQMIKDLYRGYGTPQKKNLVELDKNMPKMISMLNGIDKKARIKEEEKNHTVGKEFIW